MNTKRVILLHSKDLADDIRADLTEALTDFSVEFISFNQWEMEKDDQDTTLLTYLSDEDLKIFLPLITEKSIEIAVLPHPDGMQSRIGFGIHSTIKDAIEHLKTSPKSVSIDCMYCNDRLVFNNVIIGDTFHLVTSGSTATISPFKRLKHIAKKFFTLRPFDVKLNTDSKELRTAVAGIVAVQHGRGSLLSRFILENTFANDGRFHIFLISPRSLSQLVLFAFRSIFKQQRMPPFSAHVKTNEVWLSGSEPFDFSEDGLSQSAEEIHLKIVDKQIKMIPGYYLGTTTKGEEANDIFKVNALPSKAHAKEMVGKKLPLISHASTEEFQHLFTQLRSNAELKTSYLVLMILSTMLATFGIFANSTPVVIGAMILAPLMAPIISLSMAVLRQEKKLSLNSTRTILGGLLAGFLCAMIVTFFTPLNTPNSEILSRVRPNLLDLGIAVVSGVAGAYAHAREEIAKTLAGVAIAVALVPPLAVSGIGLAWLDMEVFLGALLLLLTNLAGMILAGALTFLVMGYSPFRLARKGVFISLIFVVVLSLPLALSFNRMVQEHTIVSQIEKQEYGSFAVKDARVIRLNPLLIGITVTTDHQLSELELNEIKTKLQHSLERDVDLEITVAITR